MFLKEYFIVRIVWINIVTAQLVMKRDTVNMLYKSFQWDMIPAQYVKKATKMNLWDVLKETVILNTVLIAYKKKSVQQKSIKTLIKFLSYVYQ